MLTALDNQLNKITMYKLVLWSLRILAGVGLILSLTGSLGLSFGGMVVSLLVLMVVCGVTNKVMAKALRVGTNTESYAITLLILFLILPPAHTALQAASIALAGFLAILSKFLVTYNYKHIFNPAALGAAVVSVLGLLGTAWWIGNSLMWPLVLVLGLLIVRKIRRFSLLLTFIIVSLLIVALRAYTDKTGVGTALQLAITSSPLIFLGSVMLTEPSTMPPRRTGQIIYGAIVGLLYAGAWQIGKLFIYPEMALLIGNIYAFVVSPKYRLRLRFERAQQFSDRVYNFVFTSGRRPQFVPGQYMEWTLPHDKEDSRGNRRTFSIASSPTERGVQLGVKFYDPSSSYKKILQGLQPGDRLFAGQIAGDFTLPANKNTKLALIAGGIGITPIRSMLKYVVDTAEKRDIVVVYSVSDPSEVAYSDVLQAAEKHGIRVIKLLSSDYAGSDKENWQGETGKLTADFIREHIPDFKDRTFYLSGPQPMVQSSKHMLRDLGIAKIKTDFFTGY